MLQPFYRAFPAIAFGSFLLSTTAAKAQWVITNLNPAGATESQVLGMSGGQQVGFYTLSGHSHAALWSGTLASLVDLNPTGIADARAWGISGGQQVGYMTIGTSQAAVMWSGTAASWVNLNPTGSNQSMAKGIGAGHQYGFASVNAVRQASMWSGSGASWTSLAPANALDSVVSAASGSQAVGSVSMTGTFQAALWNGSAASWVNLQGGYPSNANGTDGIQQVGNATLIGNTAHAMVWTGTAASAVDLDPGGPNTPVGSVAYAVKGGIQVGWYNYMPTLQVHACLWTGTAASMVDLHTFLPSNYSSSAAQAIWSDANATYIGGFARNSTTGHNEAMLWTRINCTPASVSSHPADLVVCVGNSATFAITGAGSGTISYRWQIESAPSGSNVWTDLADGPINLGFATATNSGTATLLITNSQPSAAARYRCRVTNACGNAPSNPATLTVNSADFNGDGDSGTDADIEAYFACLGGNCCPTCGSGDFNGDGDVGTDADIEAFFRVLGGGSC